LLWVAASESCLFFFFILRTDVLTIPKVILLVTFFISIVISKTGLYLLSGWSFLGLCKL
jgi:hypothetical protein